MVRAAALVLVSLLLAGCGSHDRTSDQADDPRRPLEAAPGQEPPGAAHDRPPPVKVLVDGEAVPIWQGSYCWSSDESGVCVDTTGPSPQDLVDVGSPESVEIDLGMRVDHVSVVLVPRGTEGCSRSYDAAPDDLGDGRFRIHPVGPAGDYRVEVRGRVEQGEIPGTFRWRTPVDGPLPEPEARMSIVWEPDGRPEGQGFLFTVDGLSTTPVEAAARVTVTAGNGERTEFDAGEPHLGCPASGYLAFSERGTALSDRVASLGPIPFRYDVDLTLDGRTFHGAGTYPEPVDTDPDSDNPAPVLLSFTPPLSADAPR